MGRRQMERQETTGTAPQGAEPLTVRTPVGGPVGTPSNQDATRPVEVAQLQLQKSFQDSSVEPMTVQAPKEGKPSSGEDKDDSGSLNPTNERRGAVNRTSVAQALAKFQ